MKPEPLIDTEMQYEANYEGKRYAYLLMALGAKDTEPDSWYVTDESAERTVRRDVIKHGVVPDVELDGTITLIRVGWHGKPKLTVTLKPTRKMPLVTKSMADDLEELIKCRNPVVHGPGRIRAGFYSVPPAATARLWERGLIDFGDNKEGDPVTVTLTGHLALALRTHRAETTHPIGEYTEDGPLPTGGARAHCTCGWSCLEPRRDQARAVAKQHREEQLRAAIIRFAKR